MNRKYSLLPDDIKIVWYESPEDIDKAYWQEPLEAKGLQRWYGDDKKISHYTCSSHVWYPEGEKQSKILSFEALYPKITSWMPANVEHFLNWWNDRQIHNDMITREQQIKGEL